MVKLINLLKIEVILNLIELFVFQICGTKDPTNITDCIYSSYEEQACCFINYNKTKTGCLFVPQNSTFITPYINYLDFGLDSLFSIKIECGKEKEKDIRICGKNPKFIDDCLVHSNTTHDCCMFHTSIESYCLWNSKDYRKNTAIFGTNITCYEELSGIYIKNIMNSIIFYYLIWLIFF